MTAKSSKPEVRNFAVNRQAPHLYHLLEKFETGIELTGTEVKSIREGKVNLKDSYATVKDDQVWLINCHISAYSAGSYSNPDPIRQRRLVLHLQEKNKMSGPKELEGLYPLPTRDPLQKKFNQGVIAFANSQED